MSDKLQLVGLVRAVLLHYANLTLDRQAKAYRTSAAARAILFAKAE
jgi:hypothetical protein